MRTSYMMTVEDVMSELGVKRSKVYSILKQLNNELTKEGYVAVCGKIPRPYWQTNFMVTHDREFKGGFVCGLIRIKHREPGMGASGILTGLERKSRICKGLKKWIMWSIDNCIHSQKQRRLKKNGKKTER